MHDLRDEYRLVAFILEVKGFQFIQIGMIQAIIGGIQYLQCVNLQSTLVTCSVPLLAGTDNLSSRTTHTCATTGPGTTQFFYPDMALFAAQTILVWICFALLPMSQKKGVRKLAPGSAHHKFHREASDEENPSIIASNDCCGCCTCTCYTPCATYRRRGGHLRRLIIWDVGIALLMISLVIISLFTRSTYGLPHGHFTEWEWQFKADLYWIRILFAVLSCPFAMFALPTISRFLLHVRATGYNRAGQCVPMIPSVDTRNNKQSTSASNNDGNGNGGSTKAATVVPLMSVATASSPMNDSNGSNGINGSNGNGVHVAMAAWQPNEHIPIGKVD